MGNLFGNKNILRIESPKSIAIADKVRALERAGKSIIKFQTGDPDFETHKNIIQALEESLSKGETHYTNSQGIPELRETICEYFSKLYKVPIDPDKNIIITAGGAQAIFLSLMCVLNPKDEVILLEPYYPQYAYIVQLLGGVIKTIPPIFQRCSYIPDYNVLNKIITKKSRALILNSPNNPSGKIFSSEEINDLIEIAFKKNLHILSDEVYSQIIDDGKKHISFLEYPEIFDKLIYINSFSKSYAMTGWRLGFVIANESIISRILRTLQLNITSIPLFIQRAGVVALKDKEVQEYVNIMKRSYNQRRKLVYDMVKDHPLLKIYPDGAFYYLFQLPSSITEKTEEWVTELLEKELVAAVPASVYGNSVKNFFRISFSIDYKSLAEGINRIIDFYKNT